MSIHSDPSPTAPTSSVQNTAGHEKEISQENLNGPASDAALREYCDNHYNQLLPILAEKMHQEKLQQERLKAVKARLNFEEVSQHSELGTPSRGRDIKKRIGSKRIRSTSESPEPRHDRSESPRKRGPERETMFKRLEKGVFHKLGDKEKSMSAYSDDSRHQSYHNNRRDTESCYPSSHPRRTEPASKKHHSRKASSYRTEVLSETVEMRGTNPFTPRIRYFKVPKKSWMPSNVKTYDGSGDPEDHLKIFQAAKKVERGEVAASNQAQKMLPAWKQQEVGRNQNFDLKGDFQNQQRSKRRRDKFTLLTKSPREILALDKEEEGTEGLVIIEAEIGGHFIHRMYVDGESASKILYEHCFNRLYPKIKNQMVPATAPLIGFGGEIIWPLGQISLLVKIGDEEHSTSAWMNFVIVRSSSPYNGIIGRPGVRKIQSVPSTAHGMLKFPVAGGILTLKRSKIIPIECATVSRPGGQPPAVKQVVEERIKNPVDMTGVPRHIAEHQLNIREGCPPVRQKRIGQAADRNQAIQEEVEKLVYAGIMKEVHYHSWLSNLHLVDKAFHKQISRNLEVYVDDLVIKIRMEDEIIRDVEETFKTLGEINMKLNPKNVPSGFLAKSAEKSLPLFKTLKKCTKKSDFHWTKEVKSTFKQMKQLIAKLLALTAPEEKKELIVHLAAAKEAVSAVLMTKREAKQMPIYFVSRALRGPKVNYTSMEKLVLALVHASKRLKRYFQAHPIIAITDQPIKQVLSRPKVAGRLQKYSIKLGEYAIHYRPRVSIKGQILTDFIVEHPKEDFSDTPMDVEEELLEPWILFINGSSYMDGSRAGLILTNPEGAEFTYALRFKFEATNNEAEYEALIAILRIAKKMGEKKL
nr:reverse transcriptase domain-containing protein [Tanacetum cinerariifolium]